jgi:hypothetical protein
VAQVSVYKTHKYSVGRTYNCWMLYLLVHRVTRRTATLPNVFQKKPRQWARLSTWPTGLPFGDRGRTTYNSRHLKNRKVYSAKWNLCNITKMAAQSRTLKQWNRGVEPRSGYRCTVEPCYDISLSDTSSIALDTVAPIHSSLSTIIIFLGWNNIR